MSRQSVSPCLRLALPKGRMEQAVLTLLGDAGIRIRPGARGYRPEVSLPGTEAKILKPQNIVEMLSLGSRDLGFAGADWVAELEANVVELLDTGLDPVQVVAAAPQELLENGALPARPLVVAWEYERLARRWVAARGGGWGVPASAGAGARGGEGSGAGRPPPRVAPRREGGRRHRRGRLDPVTDRPMTPATSPATGPVSRIDPEAAYRRPTAPGPALLRPGSNAGPRPPAALRSKRRRALPQVLGFQPEGSSHEAAVATPIGRASGREIVYTWGV